jgi:hypothetical protein
MAVYPASVRERLKVQEVILRAVNKQITSWEAAHIARISPRQLRRLYERYRRLGFECLCEKQGGRGTPQLKRPAHRVGMFGICNANHRLRNRAVFARRATNLASRYRMDMISFSFTALRSSIFLVSAWDTLSNSSRLRFFSSSLIFFSFSSFSMASLTSRRTLRTAVR